MFVIGNNCFDIFNNKFIMFDLLVNIILIDRVIIIRGLDRENVVGEYFRILCCY